MSAAQTKRAAAPLWLNEAVGDLERLSQALDLLACQHLEAGDILGGTGVSRPMPDANRISAWADGTSWIANSLRVICADIRRGAAA